MTKILKLEASLLFNKLKDLDFKSVIIFLSSTILFTISWYYSNPKYFSEIFSFHKSFELVYEDLTAFSFWFIFDTILFLFIPIIIVLIIFKEKLRNYGLRIGKWKTGLSFSILSIIVFIPIIYFISYSSIFRDYFPLMESATDNLLVFLIYEALFILFILSWEFIFRGFMLFGLEKKFGLYSILIQMIPFVMLHNGKPFIETFTAIFGGLFLGYLALRTRSIFYGFLIHTFILLSLDIIAFLKA
ncbi:MAG: CPBP family intramembrane metalloprotease [Melioribacteraceae bacterium]|nr:CPBP family intramembrane metalloprotease [Melioribacteraceae bacterium]